MPQPLFIVDITQRDIPELGLTYLHSELHTYVIRHFFKDFYGGYHIQMEVR